MKRAIDLWRRWQDRAGEWLGGPSPRHRRRRMLAWAGAALLAWGLFGGDQGLVALLSTQRQKGALRAEISALEASTKELNAQMAQLAADPRLYEKVAREKLMLKKPDEVLYRFHD